MRTRNNAFGFRSVTVVKRRRPTVGGTGKSLTRSAPGSSPRRIASRKFLLVHHAVSLQRRQVLVERTQWDATCKTLGYFYSDMVPSLEPPPLEP